jgi:hypothetical protein
LHTFLPQTLGTAQQLLKLGQVGNTGVQFAFGFLNYIGRIVQVLELGLNGSDLPEGERIVGRLSDPDSRR